MKEYDEDVIEVGDILAFQSKVTTTLERYGKLDRFDGDNVIMRTTAMTTNSKHGPFRGIMVIRPLNRVRKLRVEELI